ncbi:phosphatidate cytidylyltransferase [Streptomyces abyssalis]|uniref:Phosphatidate cytidylyltransferase n=1 Tax=Streptomyces abyssalis TaxID=933944 RepID=A0A1E7JHD1_9ACTN|nr:phosphatidate cytidylyltransferase [Streptomyces abyssalis]OEU85896.1 phosphatidate cytidylyltransferase [Streptomyces abyssalis]OEU92638.1 phosphatidate cytidylyltransferase [Streptomyces abyssalis]OEV29204.1 phosphatidate cytidylyltransferase [Streptomyces nanshensis]
MNDSSWGAPRPRAGFPGAPGQGGAAPRGEFRSGAGEAPAHEAGGVPQTRDMPIVSDPGGSDGGHGRSGPGGPHGLHGSGDSRRSGGPGGPGGSGSRESGPAPDSGPARRPGSGASDPGPAPLSGKKRAGRDLRAAIGVGVGLGAVILASLFFYKPVFLGVIVVAVVVGLWELTSRLSERKEIQAPLVPLAVGGAAMVIAGYLRGPEGAWVVMALTALAVLVWRMTESPEDYLRDVTAAVFATFYVPFLATFVALMLAADDGPWRVLTFLLLTVVSDTGAYAVGWRFGKHKLAPAISPAKTREGLGGAIAFSMAAGALCTQFLIDGGSWWQGLLLGLAVAVTATLGDLGESMMKRDLGIKDMGTLLPGHGGIMDRLDSLLPTAPVVWLLFVAFVGGG